VANIVALNSEAHRNLRVRPEPAARLGDAQRFVPVVVNEFPLLALHYPLFLSKDADTGAFYCGAMLGFDEGENLFIGEDVSLVYRPLNLQRGPFFAAGTDLAIDLDHPRVDPTGAERLFAQDGEPSAYLKSIMALMRDLKPGHERTKVFLETLIKLRIVEPVSIDARFDDGTRLDVTDLYTIDREALGLLPDEAVVDLFRRGYLQLVYLLIASLKHVPLLARRKNRRFLEDSGAPAAPLG
jgi:SapC